MKKLLIAFAMLITSMGVFAQAKDSSKMKKAHVKTAPAATTAGPTKKRWHRRHALQSQQNNCCTSTRRPH